MIVDKNAFILALLLIFFITGISLSQTNTKQLANEYKFLPTDAKTWVNPSRIQETSYKLLMYNQNKDVTSTINIVERTIAREDYNSTPCIKITEINTAANPKTKAVVYIDAKTLKPVYFENHKGDALVQKAVFENKKVTVIDINNGIEKATETDNSSDPYISNSFSELIQANDFSKNRIITFETFSPGNSANRFAVERIAEKEFMTSVLKKIDCWVLKFTRTDSKGVESLAGYRYVDKKSGKVLMFKSNINTDIFFTYQIIFLN